jgi:ADP-heptose:LPS heptosyltransferase
MEEAKKCAADSEYNIVREITMNPNIAFFKVDRVAVEMGVHPLKCKRPRLKMTREYFDYGKRVVDGLSKPIVFFHGVAGNFRKTLSKDMAKFLIEKSNARTIIECGSHYFKNSVKYKPESIMKTAGIVANVERVFCIDSIVMHIAHALRVATTVLFTITPPQQVLGPNYMNIDKMRVIYYGQ